MTDCEVLSGVVRPSHMSQQANYVNDVCQQSDLLFIAASFWFEESPCTVQTNTASLDRLCTLSMLPTLLVFEHIHAFFIEYACSMCTMVTTKQCCYGACRSNYRYADLDRFLKSHLDRANVERWANVQMGRLYRCLYQEVHLYDCVHCILSVILCSL